MNYLTRDDILDLHMLAVERYGGRLGIRSQDRLLALVAAPQQVMFGSELYPDLASKAAVLAFMMLKNRPFNGANEATTLLVVLRFLAINGVEWEVLFPRKLASALQGILQSEWNQEELATWLRAECGIRMDAPW
jgi:death on curing protein